MMFYIFQIYFIFENIIFKTMENIILGVDSSFTYFCIQFLMFEIPAKYASIEILSAKFKLPFLLDSISKISTWFIKKNPN